LEEDVLSLFPRRFRPFLECFLGRLDSIIQVVLTCNRNIPELGLIRGVYTLVDFEAAPRLPRDRVVKFLPVNRDSVMFTHLVRG
jgi:hypothetical protein